MDAYFEGAVSIVKSPSDPNTTNYFFMGRAFSGKTILLAWEHAHFIPLNDLFTHYLPNGGAPLLSRTPWPGTDFYAFWTVKIDAQGTLKADNLLCEGIDSTTLQANFSVAPQF